MLSVSGLLAFGEAQAIQVKPLGPAHFYRQQGAPVAESVPFAADNLNGSFTLTVYNGGLQDNATLGEYVSGSVIKLNGAAIVGPQNFNQSTASVTVPVSLQSANQLSVELRGKPGGVVTVEVNTPPVADAGGKQTVLAGSGVQLNGGGSYDPDGDPLSYAWTLVSRPANSLAVIGNAQSSSASFTADVEGDYVVGLVVNDGAASSTQSQVVITALPHNQPPVLSSIGNRTVAAGTTLILNLSASNADGDTLTYSAQPLPLPAGASLDGATGRFQFKPNATQVGDIHLTFSVSDGVFTDTETVTFTVPAIDATATTRFKGRVLDANAYAQGIVAPIAGATVSFLHTGQSAQSDAQGYFFLDNLPDGTQVIDIDASTAFPAADGSRYAGFRENYKLIAHVENTEARPFYLPQIDAGSLTPVNPAATTVVTNSDLGVSISVPPHTAKNPDGSDFTGELSISPVPRNFAPAALPDNLDPGLLVTIQPVGVTFAAPVPFTFPNLDNLAPGSEADIWSLNPEMGAFDIVGTGRVSADGQRIETIAGGVRAADWHSLLPPSASLKDDTNENEAPNQNPCEQDGIKSTSTLTTATGCLNTGFSLPAYHTQGQARSVAFAYKSRRAHASPAIPFDITIPARSTVPSKVSYEVYVGEVKQGREIFVSTAGFSESVDETFRAVATFDAGRLPTGVYPYRIRVTNHFGQSRVASDVRGQISIVNQLESDSPFGVGWDMPGLSRLHLQADGQVFLTDGSGEQVQFTQEGQNNPSLHFDGNDYLLRAGIPSLYAHSIEFWVRLASGAQQLYGGVAGIGPLSGGCGLGSLFRLLGDRSVWWHVDPAGCGGFGSGNITSPALTDAWVHMAGTYDGTTAKLYVNGELIGASPAQYTSSTNFVLGTDAFGFGSAYMRGDLDEVRLWNHARTQEQIRASMQKSLAGPVNGLVLYWPMNEGQGLSTADLSGSGLPGNFPAPANAPVWNAAGAPMDCSSGNCTYSSGKGDYSTLINSGAAFIRTLKNGTQIHFSSDGLQTQVIDRNGNSTRYAYDGDKRLTAITDPAGQSTAFTYLNNRLDSVTDPAGRVSRFEYDAEGNLIKVTFPDGSFKTFGYDARHLMTSESDERGFTAVREYDATGRVFHATRADGSTHSATHAQTVGLIDPASGLGTADNPAPAVRPGAVANTFTDGEGHTQTSTTDRFGRLLARTDANGLTTRIERDENGNPVKTTRPDGSAVSREFDARGNLLSETEDFNHATTRYSYDPVFNLPISVTDALNRTTLYQRDNRGNITAMINPLGQTTAFAYNAAGQVTQITAPNGLVTDISYNPAGLPDTVGETPPAGSGNARTTHIVYDAAGQAVQIDSTPDGSVLTLEYDLRGRLLSIADAEGQRLEYRYDAAGNRIAAETQASDGTLVQTVARTFDALNRLNSIRAPHSGAQESQWQYRYDGADNLADGTDANGNATSQSYDPGNRLIERIDALLGSTAFTYDRNGHVTRVSAPNGAATAYEIDALGRVIAESSGDRGTTHYTYDLNNNLKTRSDARGVTVTYSYDALDRLTGIAYPDSGENVALGYDSCPFGQGRLCSVGDASGATAFEYDAYGNVTRITENRDGIDYSQTYRYDGGHRLTGMTLPSGRSIDYSRDTLRRIQRIDTTLNGGSQTVTDNIGYNAAGQIVRGTYGNGLSETFGYDLQGRRLQQTLQSVEQTGLSYDANGNVLSRNTALNTHSYGYDALDRLADEMNDGLQTGYGYDANGNRLSATQEAQSTSYAYTPQSNRLQTIATASATQTLSHDATGNVVQDAQGRQYVYNNAGRLAELHSDGQIVNYRYNARGLRTHKITATATTVYHYDLAGHLVSETRGDGTPLRDYIWHGDTPIAQIDNHNGTETLSYLHTDHLNTPRLATSANQSATWRWEGDAFGTMPPQSFGVTVNLRYPGQYYDAESGLHYNWEQYYDLETGRYVTSDPIGLQGGVNTYGYAFQNPIRFTDPSGLFVDEAAVQAAIQGVATAAGVATSAVAATVTGVAAAVYPSPVGEGSDQPPRQSEACPPKPGNQDPCKGLREQLAAHEAKLAQYLNDSLSMDNKGFLKDAIGKGNMDLFWKIRANRIKELKSQIENFRKQLEECERRYG